MEIKIEGLDKIIKNLDDMAKKQVPFATARALTKTAEDARDEIVKDLPGKFTLRTSWWKPRTRYGFNVKPAKKTDLKAEIFTQAPWMQIHEVGGIRTPERSRELAIPTLQVRRTKRQLIGASQRPRALKKSFVKITRTGQKVLFQKVGKKGIKPMYLLEPKARIKPVLRFVETAKKIITQRFESNFTKSFEDAMRTAK